MYGDDKSDHMFTSETNTSMYGLHEPSKDKSIMKMAVKNRAF